jgi:hypothetical protein
MQAVRRAVPARQFDRFKRIYDQPFYVLDAAVDEGGLRFTVSGSMRDAYKMTISRATGLVWCACIDASTACRAHGMVCKHVCFLLYRVLRLEELAFLGVRKLTPSELGAVEARAACVIAAASASASASAAADVGVDGVDGVAVPAAVVLRSWQVDLLCNQLDAGLRISERGGGGGGGGGGARSDFAVVARPPEPSDECPVCYDVLLAAGDGAALDLRGCPDCGRAVHAGCARRWICRAPRATCVYCRSPVWARWDKV